MPRRGAGGFAGVAPTEIAYAPRSDLQPGEGFVRFVIGTAQDLGNDRVKFCQYTLRYRPLAEAAVVTDPVGVHLSDSVDACARPHIEFCEIVDGDFTQDPCDRPNPPSFCNRSLGGPEDEETGGETDAAQEARLAAMRARHGYGADGVHASMGCSGCGG